jgi:protein SCO1/2
MNTPSGKESKKIRGKTETLKPGPVENKVNTANDWNRRVLILMGVVIIFFGALGWFLYQVPLMKNGPIQVVESTGKVAIGGPFTLVDHFNKTVSETDFYGQNILVFFGYTYCPDVCPTTLTDISDALKILGSDAKYISPIFITIDPERDRPENLKEYIKHFHPNIIGMSGSVEQVKAVASAYRVFYQKSQEKGADSDDYLMNHSSIAYLMGKDGKYLDHFSYGTSAKDMAAKIKALL